MKLTDLNRNGGIGANSMLLQIGDLNVLVDSGLHPKISGRKATPDFSKIEGIYLDLIIITHCHLDHIGSLPLVMKQHPNTPVIMSASSRMLIKRMLHNSVNVMTRQREEENIPEYPLFTHNDVDRIDKRIAAIPFGQAKRFVSTRGDQITIILHHAGHVAGAAGVELIHKRRHIFITGDVMFQDQKILKGARFPAGHFDTLITESTRGDTERPEGKERQREVERLIETVNDTIRRGGSVLIPVFALGRHQELLALLHGAKKNGKLVDCPIICGGLGMDLCDYFDEISRKTKDIQFNRGIIKELHVQSLPRKLNPGEDPGRNAIYLISSGMMIENTPSYVLASGLLDNARNTIAFVGYNDPDTPGGRLLRSKAGEEFLFESIHVKTKLKARIERFELSGHAEREELLQFALQATPRAVVVTHGDPAAREWFVEQLTRELPKAKVLNPVPLETYQV